MANYFSITVLRRNQTTHFNISHHQSNLIKQILSKKSLVYNHTTDAISVLVLFNNGIVYVLAEILIQILDPNAPT